MNSKIISVRGYGNLKVSPNLIIIDFVIEVENKSYDKAYEIYKDALKRFNETIILSGFSKKDLKTKYWNAEPVTRYKDRYNLRNERITEKIIKYKINHSLKLEFDLNKETLSKILTEISNSEFPLDLNIRYGVKDKESVKNELLKKTIRDAKNKAKILVESLGEQLGELKNINYNVNEIGIRHSIPIQAELNSLNAEKTHFNEFEPDDIEFNDDVEVIWTIK